MKYIFMSLAIMLTSLSGVQASECKNLNLQDISPGSELIISEPSPIFELPPLALEDSQYYPPTSFRLPQFSRVGETVTFTGEIVTIVHPNGNESNYISVSFNYYSRGKRLDNPREGFMNIESNEQLDKYFCLNNE